MLSELGFIDWVALVIAAILLAGAASSLIIVTVAAQQRRRGPFGYAYRPNTLEAATPSVARASAPDADVIDLRASRQSSGVTRAARADRLRRRPQPDVPPPIPASARREAEGGVSTIARRARAHVGPRQGFAPRGPGFFDDPMGRHQQRYWDGERWTEYVKDDGIRFKDPL